MSRRRSLIVVALLAAFAAEGLYAAPARAVAEIRAMSCCARHCEHALPAAGAGHCCELAPASGPTGPSTKVAYVSAPALASLGHALDSSLRVLARPAPAPRGNFEFPPPIFLLTRSLLL